MPRVNVYSDVSYSNNDRTKDRDVINIGFVVTHDDVPVYMGVLPAKRESGDMEEVGVRRMMAIFPDADGYYTDSITARAGIYVPREHPMIKLADRLARARDRNAKEAMARWERQISRV